MWGALFLSLCRRRQSTSMIGSDGRMDGAALEFSQFSQVGQRLGRLVVIEDRQKQHGPPHRAVRVFVPSRTFELSCVVWL